MNGLLLTLTEPSPRDEEEFNAWHDTAALPLRARMPGVRDGRRDRADSAPPRFVALSAWMTPARLKRRPANATDRAQRSDALTAGCAWILRGCRAWVPERA